MKTFKILTLLVVVLLAACKKEPTTPPKGNMECQHKAKFETAICGWGEYENMWIRLDNGTLLQPCKTDIALNSNQIYEGREIEVSYEEMPSNCADCQSGIVCLAWPGEYTSAKITCLKLLGEDKPVVEEPKCEYNTMGILRDWHGKLDGCGWIIEVDNGDILEVLDNDINGKDLKDGTPVLFSYTAARRASACMAGMPIIINCIKVANTITN